MCNMFCKYIEVRTPPIDFYLLLFSSVLSSHTSNPNEAACVCPSHQHFPWESASEMSTFVMILFDYDKLWNVSAVPPAAPAVLLTCVFTPHTNIVSDPRFIVIAPRCRRPLMISYCTFTQRFNAFSFGFRRCSDFDQNPLFISEETRDYTISFEAELEGCFAYPYNFFIVYSWPEHTSFCNSVQKHRIHPAPNPRGSPKTIRQLNNILEETWAHEWF